MHGKSDGWPVGVGPPLGPLPPLYPLAASRWAWVGLTAPSDPPCCFNLAPQRPHHDPCPSLSMHTYQGFPTTTFLLELSYQGFPTRAFLPELSYQGFPTRAFLPGLCYQSFPTRAFLPGISYQGFPTRAFLPELSYQGFPTRAFLPGLFYLQDLLPTCLYGFPTCRTCLPAYMVCLPTCMGICPPAGHAHACMPSLPQPWLLSSIQNPTELRPQPRYPRQPPRPPAPRLIIDVSQCMCVCHSTSHMPSLLAPSHPHRGPPPPPCMP